MLFDAGALSGDDDEPDEDEIEEMREQFTLSVLPRMVPPVSNMVSANRLGLEWQCKDNRVLNALFNVGYVRRYILVASGFDMREIEGFGLLSPFDSIPTDFMSMKQGRVEGLQSRSVDYAVCTAYATERLGPVMLESVMKETVRILRPEGKFAFFQELGEPLLPCVRDCFTVGAQFEDQEAGITAYTLLPREEARPKLRRRRRAPPPSSG